MKPLIFFFWFFLITVNLMAKKTLVSKFEKSPLIIDSGSNFYRYDLHMKVIVAKTHLSSSQNICINNNHAHIIMYLPHSYLKSYKTGKCSEFSYTDIDKYIVSTNWNSNNFTFYFLEESFYYGKSPPNENTLK
jgi:hypothetical protein